MSDKTGIEWTRSDDGTAGATWNPVTGCTKISAGCDHCYASTFAERWRGVDGHYFERGFDVQLRQDKLLQPLKWTRPRRIFVNSMSDLFHESVPDEYIAAVFTVMAASPQHTFQVLTKRHGRMRSLLSSDGFQVRCFVAAASRGWDLEGRPWPLPNVHLGVSVEDQKWADIRIPALCETPAALRFLSCEPLLGPVEIPFEVPAVCTACGGNGYMPCDAECGRAPGPAAGRIGWVIVGGESGPGARPMHPQWARSLRDQCLDAGVPFFFKQHGEWGPAPWRVDREPGETDDAYKTRAEAECATHAYAPWAHQYGHEPHAAGHRPWSLERGTLPPEQAPIRRWGKGRAGRLLDGREWSEFPRVPVEAS